VEVGAERAASYKKDSGAFLAHAHDRKSFDPAIHPRAAQFDALLPDAGQTQSRSEDLAREDVLVVLSTTSGLR